MLKKIIYVILLIIIGLQLFFFFQLPYYAPSHQDEAIYFCSAKMFINNHSAIACTMIEENISPIGEYNWYGPFWHYLFGFINLIFGAEYGMFIFNVVLFWVIFFIAFRYFSAEFTLLVISSFSVMDHQFTGFPEIFVLLMGVISCLFVLKLYKTPENRNIILFFIWITLLIFVRVTFVVWLFALLPLISKKNYYVIILSIILGGIESWLFLKYLTAPAYAPGIKELQYIDNQSFFLLVKEIITRIYTFFVTTIEILIKMIKQLFIGRYEFTYLLLLAYIFSLFLAFIWLIVKNKIETIRYHREFLGIIFPIGMLFCILIAFYTSFPFFFVKQMDVVFPLIVLGILSLPNNFFKKSLILISLLPFPFYTYAAYKTIKTHRVYGEQYQKNKNLLSCIPQQTTSHDKLGILLNREMVFALDSDISLLFSCLPFQNKQKKPIWYTSNIREKDPFKLHYKIPIEYILTDSSHSIPKTLPYKVLKIDSCNGFYCYKIIEP